MIGPASRPTKENAPPTDAAESMNRSSWLPAGTVKVTQRFEVRADPSSDVTIAEHRAREAFLLEVLDVQAQLIAKALSMTLTQLVQLVEKRRAGRAAERASGFDHRHRPQSRLVSLVHVVRCGRQRLPLPEGLELVQAAPALDLASRGVP